MRTARLAAPAAALLMVTASACSAEPERVDILAQISAMASEAPPYQADILRDGVVTSSEYERAVLAEKACADELGFATSEVEWSYGQLGFTSELDMVSMGITEAEEPRYAEKLDDCGAQYSNVVALAYTLQETPTEDERQSIRPDVIGCLNAAGGSLEPDADDDKIAAALASEPLVDSDEATACVQKYYAYFIIQP